MSGRCSVHRCRLLPLVRVALVLVVSLGWTGARGYGQVAPAPPTPSVSDPLDLELVAELSELAARCDGTVGVSALHLPSGREVHLNADQRYPMASTYKLPIAVSVLRCIDQGELEWTREIPIREGDLHPGSGSLQHEYRGPHTRLTLEALFHRMLTESDNSATDLLLRAVGGADAVQQDLHEHGLEGMRVDRSTLRMICDWVGVRDVPEDELLAPHEFVTRYTAVPVAERDRAANAFADDPRDTSSPRAMLELLRALWADAELLSENSRVRLLETMAQCRTGPARLRGLLPPSAEVAHKTGTIGGSTNDVGIVTLPDGRGHLLIAVFVKKSRDAVPDREKAIAAIARALYDAHWVAQTNEPSDRPESEAGEHDDASAPNRTAHGRR